LQHGRVALADVLQRCAPLPGAPYVVSQGFDEHLGGEPYHETIDLDLTRHPQTLLAYDMNGTRLSIPHGAPCRLRETQLGFKMVKYVCSIELVEDYRAEGRRQGGSREDVQFYGVEAGS
jgi:sulfoxide reductase catalytic subunit YedY